MSDISSITLDGVTYSLKDALARQLISGLDDRVDTTEDNINNLISAVGTPLVASTTSQMTDHNKIYVYVGSESGYTSGNWYYWNGSVWTSGGVYNSTALETDKTLTVENAAADAKIVGDEVETLENNLYTVASITTPLYLSLDVMYDNNHTLIKNDGGIATTASNMSTSNILYCKSGATLTLTSSVQSGYLIFAVYGNHGTLNYSVAGTGYSNYIDVSYTFTNLDKYYRISGVSVDPYKSNYKINYTYFPENLITAEEYHSTIDSINGTIGYSEPTEVKSLLTQGGGIKTNGTVNSASSVVAAYSYSDYIALKEGSSITYSNVRVTNLCAIAPYDANKIFDSSTSVVATTTISGTWTMPFNGYVRLCCRNTELNGNASFVILNPSGSELADLNARINTLENTLPTEWQEYVDEKKEDIKAALVSIENTGETFTFVTDVHVPRNNMMTPKILRTLEKDCPVNYHVNGGDFIDINTDSAQSAINVLWRWKDAMSGMTEYCVLGNHDFNNYNGDNLENVLTSGQFYAILNRQIENIVNTSRQLYYTIDNESQKIRIIMLDSSLSDKTTMYSWMSNRMTELDATWTILIIQHYLWGSTTDIIHSNGQATINAVNNIWNQISASFIGILAGHTHVDYNSTESTHGYLLIARDTNMIKGGTGTNTLSFDYVTINTATRTLNFTKVGRGNDLTLQY